MNHIGLFLACIFSLKLAEKMKFLSTIGGITKLIKKIILVVSARYVNDYRKERVILLYAMLLMDHSLRLLVLFLAIISTFFIINLAIDGFITWSLSIVGFLEAAAIGSMYGFLKRIRSI